MMLALESAALGRAELTAEFDNPLLRGTKQRSSTLTLHPAEIDVETPEAQPVGRMNTARVDSTTASDIAEHELANEVNMMLAAAKFGRRVRRRLGFSQAEFAVAQFSTTPQISTPGALI